MDPAAQVAARDARQAARAANDDLPIEAGPPVNDEKGGPRDDEEFQRLFVARDDASVIAERCREENVGDGFQRDAKCVEELMLTSFTSGDDVYDENDEWAKFELVWCEEQDNNNEFLDKAVVKQSLSLLDELGPGLETASAVGIRLFQLLSPDCVPRCLPVRQ